MEVRWWVPRKGPRCGVLCVVFALALMALSGCAVEKYRQARQIFNEAAGAENGIKLEQAKVIDYNLVKQGTSLSVLPGLEQIRSKYEIALNLLQSITESDLGQLEKDGLLSDKITLEALCLWRLGRHDEIDTLLIEAKSVAGRQPEDAAMGRTRDSFVLQALPGLIINDQAHARIPSKPTQEMQEAQFENVKRSLVGPDENALRYIREARIAAYKSNHPIVSYLLQAELAVYRNLMVAYTNFSMRPNLWSTGKAEEYGEANALLTCLRKMDYTESKVVFSAWHELFGNPKLPEEETCDMTK